MYQDSPILETLSLNKNFPYQNFPGAGDFEFGEKFLVPGFSLVLKTLSMSEKNPCTEIFPDTGAQWALKKTLGIPPWVFKKV